MPRVLNKRMDEIPPDAVYVGRPTIWGNPFKVGGVYNGVRLTQELAVQQYRDWLLYSDAGGRVLAEARAQLRGKDLVCWCAPLPCHADVLLEVANAA